VFDVGVLAADLEARAVAEPHLVVSVDFEVETHLRDARAVARDVCDVLDDVAAEHLDLVYRVR